MTTSHESHCAADSLFYHILAVVVFVCASEVQNAEVEPTESIAITFLYLEHISAAQSYLQSGTYQSMKTV